MPKVLLTISLAILARKIYDKLSKRVGRQVDTLTFARCLLVGLYVSIMADAIQWSIPLGNGAVNLHYNEVVYSWFNGYIYANNYDYEIMLILNPTCVTSFVFTREAYYSMGNSSIVIYSVTPSGAQTKIGVLNYGTSRYYTQAADTSVGFLLK